MGMQARFGAGSMILAALGGAAVGAAAALLLAPKSGRKMRGQLMGYAENAKDALANVPEALKDASHAVRKAM